MPPLPPQPRAPQPRRLVWALVAVLVLTVVVASGFAVYEQFQLATRP